VSLLFYSVSFLAVVVGEVFSNVLLVGINKGVASPASLLEPSFEERQQLLPMEQGRDVALYDGLLDRSCVLDLLQRETWSTLVYKLRGTCALAGHLYKLAWCDWIP
jgi:hypothetical protein